MAADCEFEVNGNPCGVQAVGRCATCGKAFCITHQGRTSPFPPRESVAFVDMCALCYLKSPGYLATVEYKSRQREQWDAQEYFRSGSARAALVASGAQRVDIFMVQTRSVATRQLFKTVYSQHEEVRLVAPGWVLGTFRWSIRRHDQSDLSEDWLTALLDMDRDAYTEVTGSERNYETFVRIEPHPSGYRIGWGYGDELNPIYLPSAEKAVKRLIGGSPS